MSARNRIAGIAGSGLVWMVFWATAGALISIVASVIDPAVIDAGEGPVDLALILGPVGAACGLVFGVLLPAAERGRTIADVPVLRAVVWGVAAAVAVRYLTPITQGHISNIVVLGALSALVSSGLARAMRGPLPAAQSAVR